MIHSAAASVAFFDVDQKADGKHHMSGCGRLSRVPVLHAARRGFTKKHAPTCTICGACAVARELCAALAPHAGARARAGAAPRAPGAAAAPRHGGGRLPGRGRRHRPRAGLPEELPKGGPDQGARQCMPAKLAVAARARARGADICSCLLALSGDRNVTLHERPRPGQPGRSRGRHVLRGRVCDRDP